MEGDPGNENDGVAEIVDAAGSLEPHADGLDRLADARGNLRHGRPLSLVAVAAARRRRKGCKRSWGVRL
jgi:hypothetical protein